MAFSRALLYAFHLLTPRLCLKTVRSLVVFLLLPTISKGDIEAGGLGFPTRVFNAHHSYAGALPGSDKHHLNIGVIQVRLKEWTTTTPPPVIEEFYSLFRRYPGEQYPFDLAMSGIVGQQSMVGFGFDSSSPAPAETFSTRTLVGRKVGGASGGEGFNPTSALWWRRQLDFFNNTTAAYLILAIVFGLLVTFILLYLCLSRAQSSKRDRSLEDGEEAFDRGSLLEGEDLITELERETASSTRKAAANDEVDRLYRKLGRKSGPGSCQSYESTLKAGKYARRTPLYAPLPPPPPKAPPPPAPKNQSPPQQRKPAAALPPATPASRNDSSENFYCNSYGGDFSMQSSLARSGMNGARPSHNFSHSMSTLSSTRGQDTNR